MKFGFSVIALLLIIFCNLCLIYFTFAKAYFFFFDTPVKNENQNKDFYGLTIASTKPIPYEIKYQNEKRICVEDNKNIRENRVKMTKIDGASYNLVDCNKK